MFVGVVPPALMEDLFENESRDEFEDGGQQDRASVQQEQVVRKRREQQDDYHCADSVDGADRAV